MTFKGGSKVKSEPTKVFGPQVAVTHSAIARAIPNNDQLLAKEKISGQSDAIMSADIQICPGLYVQIFRLNTETGGQHILKSLLSR